MFGTHVIVPPPRALVDLGGYARLCERLEGAEQTAETARRAENFSPAPGK